MPRSSSRPKLLSNCGRTRNGSPAPAMLFANTGANETLATGVANVGRTETVGSTDGLAEMARPILRRMRRQLDDPSICGLPFVAFQRRQLHLGLARVGTMHRLAIVA